MTATNIICDDSIDVVVDLGNDLENRGSKLLESLIAAEEGITCRYHVHLGYDRPRQDVLSQLIELKKKAPTRIVSETSDLDFPQELIDLERTNAKPGDARRRAMAKQTWFEQNLKILEAIERHDEFVFLRPNCLPMFHGWLADLTGSARQGQDPVLSAHRKLRMNDRYQTCGWSAVGWYNGRILRDLPLRKAFQHRLENPWRSRIDIENRTSGAGFCLAGDWLSGFDVPIDFLIFALYFKNRTKSNDPNVWAEATEQQTDVVASDPPDYWLPGLMKTQPENEALLQEKNSQARQEENLRKLYFDKARIGIAENGTALKADVINLPIGAPVRNMLARNLLRFEIDELKDLFKGERCFIIGNGPSLNNTDLTKLRNEYTIGLNRIYLNYVKMGFQPSFLCATNPNIIRQFHHEIDALNSVKFLTYRTMDLIRNRWNTYFFESRDVHAFHEDLRNLIWCEGCTVTYCAMQVAFYLGFQTVILVGVDHNFPDTGAPHQLVTAGGPDQNHFHPDYFGKGTQWQYPDLPGSELSYRVAKSTFEMHGRKILDATVRGNLQIFEKVVFSEITNR